MAVWQFECNIIPFKNVTKQLSHEEMISWKDITQSLPKIEFLKCEKSWSKNIEQYGSADSTCIQFIYGENGLEEIDCRLDLRSLGKQQLKLLVEYVEKIGAVFLVGQKIYAPQMESMLEILKKSRANDYCKNPMGYIIDLYEKAGR